VRHPIAPVSFALAALVLSACNKPAEQGGAGQPPAPAGAPAGEAAAGAGPDGGPAAGPGGPRFFAVDQTLDQMLERTRNRFARLDGDGDGKLTRSEIEAAQAAAESQGGPGGIAGRRGAGGMMRADADGDGAVTRDEVEAQTRQRFERLDADKDGKVTGEEMMAAFPRRGDAAGSLPAE